ncbi:Polycomb protein VEFS-Box [Arabidopsis suecica]|uniref:Polycomb protein VEFS-Box n=1 Tax=Arabidopsis suecica TaxID=45249 RepID=A0A8T2E957_ARASU|nr:Polycomb protein VEFS-Box [Arabidopsis suecica]
MDPIKLTTEAKVPAKRSKATSHYLPLHKRQFYHSRTGQPLSLEQVMSDRDSENDVDKNDDAAHLEESQMLNGSMDENEIVTERFIKLWNSFVKQQRIVADAHIPWACEAFSRLHLQELRSNLSLDLCWRQFMIKQWDYGLLDRVTMNKCNTIIYHNISTTNDDINNNNTRTTDNMDVVDDDINRDKGNKETTETAPVATEATTHGEKDGMDVGGSTLCEQMESATVTESSQDVNATTWSTSTQRSFGKRLIIPTPKMIEWQWSSVGGRRSGGRRGRGRRGRGGRGREGGSASGSGNLI